jgi:hypothetical protein
VPPPPPPARKTLPPPEDDEYEEEYDENPPPPPPPPPPTSSPAPAPPAKKNYVWADAPSDQGSLETIIAVQSSGTKGEMASHRSSSFFIEDPEEPARPPRKRAIRRKKRQVDISDDDREKAEQRAREAYSRLGGVAPGLADNRKILDEQKSPERDPEEMPKGELRARIHNLRVERKHLKRELVQINDEVDDLKQAMFELNERVSNLELEVDEEEAKRQARHQ